MRNFSAEKCSKRKVGLFELTIISKEDKSFFKMSYRSDVFLQAYWMQFLNNTEARCIDYNKIRKFPDNCFPKNMIHLWGYWYPCFELQVTPVISFIRVNCRQVITKVSLGCNDPQNHLWCDTFTFV